MPPSVILLCAFAAVLGTLTVTPLAPDLRVVTGIAFAALGVYAACGRCGPPRFRAFLAVTLAAAAGNAALHQRSSPQITAHRTARYSGTILDRIGTGDGSTELTVALDVGPRIATRVYSDAPAAGTRVILRGRLEPFDEARNPDEPSEREIEGERGLDGRLEAAEILESGPGCVWEARCWLARAHEWALERLSRRLGEPAASLVAGELWGERGALPPALRTEFQETGTVHILVTAGLHLGAVAALCAALLALLAPTRWAACAIAIVLVWMFVWWSGAQLPAVRAAVMATAALTARACGRATLSWNALALAALTLAFLRPQSVATSSFALSFSCVGSIFACAGPIERWIDARIALPSRVREALVLSVATQLGIWPLGAAIFLQFTPYAVAANFAIVPCVAATMALGAAQLALEWCTPLAQACANLNSWLLGWILAVVQTIGALPGAAIPMTPAPAWCIALYAATLLAAPALVKRGAQTIVAAGLIMATCWVLCPSRGVDGRLRVTVLDVGQADAIVVQTPRGHTLLVDAGGRLERGPQTDGSVAERVGERTVVPFLLRHGIHCVDAVVISHPHGDHAGGVAPALRRLRIAQIVDSGQQYGGHAYRDAIATARTQGVPVLYPRAATRWHTDDGVVLHFIGPSLPFIGGRNAINSNSIAFLLEYGRFRMLFTGDAGSESERRFLAENVDLHADVLKVGHHGSAYGSTAAFIAAVSPRFAIISVGRHNLFGHPASSTIATLHDIGAQIYRTDEDGAVTIVTDGRSETVSSMLSNEHRRAAARTLRSGFLARQTGLGIRNRQDAARALPTLSQL